MVDSPFYRSYQDLPRPRVRDIPVQFVGSDRRETQSENRSNSAVKIQKVFRGFLVRKSVRKIAEIRAEVEEIERRMSEKETAELISRGSKERLRVNETLMSLLFKLDSVRGVDSGVRDFRKAVIKRAIALQEILDSVVVNSNRDNVDQMEDDHCDDEDLDWKAKECTEDDSKDHDCEKFVNEEVVNDCCPEESVGTSRTENRFGSSSVNPDSLVEECEEEEDGNDDDASSKQEKNDDRIEEKGENVQESKEESVRGRELLLERMVEDNEKMMDMMAQLFERNEMQTRLLSSLSQRVEQLERALLCNRMRRKKKRQAAGAGTVNGCEMYPDVKKCGKR